jgi:hypothetical protein
MRSSVTRLGIVAIVVFLAPVWLYLAAAPSRPGMFMYPVRQLMSQMTGPVAGPSVIGVPAALRQEGDTVPGSPQATSEPVGGTAVVVATQVLLGPVDYVDPQLMAPTVAATATPTPNPARAPIPLASDTPDSVVAAVAPTAPSPTSIGAVPDVKVEAADGGGPAGVPSLTSPDALTTGKQESPSGSMSHDGDNRPPEKHSDSDDHEQEHDED